MSDDDYKHSGGSSASDDSSGSESAWSSDSDGADANDIAGDEDVGVDEKDDAFAFGLECGEFTLLEDGIGSWRIVNTDDSAAALAVRFLVEEDFLNKTVHTSSAGFAQFKRLHGEIDRLKRLSAGFHLVCAEIASMFRPDPTARWEENDVRSGAKVVVLYAHVRYNELSHVNASCVWKMHGSWRSGDALRPLVGDRAATVMFRPEFARCEQPF